MSISRYRIRHFSVVGTSRKAAIVIFCFYENQRYISPTDVAHKPYQCVNISDRLVRVLPHRSLYLLLSPGIMHILTKFEGDVNDVKLDMPEVDDNIPDDLRMSVCFKSESKARSLIIIIIMTSSAPIS